MQRIRSPPRGGPRGGGREPTLTCSIGSSDALRTGRRLTPPRCPPRRPVSLLPLGADAAPRPPLHRSLPHIDDASRAAAAMMPDSAARSASAIWQTRRSYFLRPAPRPPRRGTKGAVFAAALGTQVLVQRQASPVPLQPCERRGQRRSWSPPQSPTCGSPGIGTARRRCRASAVGCRSQGGAGRSTSRRDLARRDGWQTGQGRGRSGSPAAPARSPVPVAT